MRQAPLGFAFSVFALGALACGPAKGPAPTGGEGQGVKTVEPATPVDHAHANEVHLTDVRQLTRDAGENAEAYWSHDGKELIFQSKRPPYQCDQIMRVPADGSAPPSLVSTGKGRTTCAYFMPGNQRTVWSSTHLAGDACPPEPDRSQGYVWPLYPTYDIFTSDADGKNMVKLTDSPAYDAEATVCPVDGSIIFTSTRDGDLDLYRMDADGKNVVRLTSTPGYDGGAFFSRDCKHIVWRASRPTGDALADYQRLLKNDMVRPSKLEVFVADADGANARQVTYLNSASFAPYFHPSNKTILFSTNYPNPRGREFDIYAINVDGTGLKRITYAEGFDGFPMFSPDGTQLAFGSNRNQAKPGETDVYVARWVEDGGTASTSSASASMSMADQFAADVAWLADDARGGRGVGEPGLEASAAWIEEQMGSFGATPVYPAATSGAKKKSFRQSMSVPVSIQSSPQTSFSITRQQVARGDFIPASFSANKNVSAKTVYLGYGISAPELGHDDYRRVGKRRIKGKIAVVRRFVPKTEPFSETVAERRYSDLYYKAFLAREAGAVGMIVVDIADPPPADKPDAKPGVEVGLPTLTLERLRNVGIPVVIAKRSVANKLVKGSFFANISVSLLAKTKQTDNVVGVIRAGAKTVLPGAVVVGAHYDHLGFGTISSLEPGVHAPHNGADDNASGVAGLLAVGRALAADRSKLSRDVYLVAFTAEEMGLLGSNHFVANLPAEIKATDIVAMLNMDMIGRLRENKVAALGTSTATEWADLVTESCAEARIDCNQGGGGYGPSDQTSFYAVGVPVIHFFTGAHGDYHKTTDDTGGINAAGGARVAAAVGSLALKVANRDGRLSYQKVAPPLPQGDRRSYGASLGTIPDYASKTTAPGMLLSGVRPGGPADKAGLTRGDRIVNIGGTGIGSVQDLVFVLRSAKPGERVPVTFFRGKDKMIAKVTFGKSTRRRR